MDFDTLEDRKRQQRLDNKVDNYLDNIEAMVRGGNKEEEEDLLALTSITAEAAHQGLSPTGAKAPIVLL